MCVGSRTIQGVFKPRLVEMLQSDIDMKKSYICSDVKLLGVQLDEELSMKKRVNTIVQTGMHNVKVLNGLRNVIESDIKITLVKYLVLTTLDYCNVLLALIPNYLITKLQKIENAAIRFIYKLKKRENITPYLKAAHFLPVKLRICYKLCIEVFKVLNNISPSYLADLLSIFVPKRQGLRSSTDYALAET